MNNVLRLKYSQALAAAILAVLLVCASASPAQATHGFVPWSGPAWYVAAIFKSMEDVLIAGPFADEATCLASEAFLTGEEIEVCVYYQSDPG